MPTWVSRQTDGGGGEEEGEREREGGGNGEIFRPLRLPLLEGIDVALMGPQLVPEECVIIKRI